MNELKENVPPRSLPRRRTQHVTDVRSAEPIVTDEGSDPPRGMGEIKTFEEETIEDKSVE